MVLHHEYNRNSTAYTTSHLGTCKSAVCIRIESLNQIGLRSDGRDFYSIYSTNFNNLCNAVVQAYRMSCAML